MKLKDFFYFNRSDRAVLLFFLCLAVVSMAFIFIVGGDGEDTVLETEDTLSRRESPYSSYRSHANRHYIEAENRQVERFAFDPNTADSTELLRLGLHYWQVRNIYKYRAAGAFTVDRPISPVFMALHVNSIESLNLIYTSVVTMPLPPAFLLRKDMSGVTLHTDISEN